MDNKKLVYSHRNLSEIYSLNQPKYICFPTNTHVNKTGLCYLFGKCYDVVKSDYTEIIKDYANILNSGNFSVDLIKTVGYNILLSFPTRYHWKYNTNPQLVKKSCCQLYMLQKDNKLIDGLKIYLPLQVDGYTDFNVQQLIEYLQQYLIKINNLEIILL